MKPFEMKGMNSIGNKKLLEEPRMRIGVFASRSMDDNATDIIREQWAMAKGRDKKCVVSTFHSRAELEILYLVLKHGGSAIWFLGCSLPKSLPSFAKKYVKCKKLLIVSCFHREHHSIYTARYCCHLTDMVSSYLVFFNRKEKGLLTPIYERASSRGKWIESF